MKYNAPTTKPRQMNTFPFAQSIIDLFLSEKRAAITSKVVVMKVTAARTTRSVE